MIGLTTGKMYEVDNKLLTGIKSMHVVNLVCVRVNVDENEWFKIDSRVRQGCIMSPTLFKFIYGCSVDGGENEDGEEAIEVPGGTERVEITWPLVCR